LGTYKDHSRGALCVKEEFFYKIN